MNEAERARLDARWEAAGALGRLLGCVQVIIAYRTVPIPDSLLDRLEELYAAYVTLSDPELAIQRRLDAPEGP